MKNKWVLLAISLTNISIIINAQPHELWNKQYHGNFGQDVARRMVKDNSGNFVVTGSSIVSYPGLSNYQVLTIKYDSLGNQVWINGEDNPMNSSDDVTDLIIDDSDNVYLAGIHPNSFLLKYDSTGIKKWIKGISPSYYEDVSEVDKQLCIDNDGNIYCCIPAWINGHVHSSIWKYSPGGELIWNKHFDDLSGSDDKPISIIYDHKAYLYMAGSIIKTDTNINYYVYKIDQNGDVIWAKDYGTDTYSYNFPKKLIYGKESDLYLLGRRNDMFEDNQFNIMKLDTAGNIIWEKSISGGAPYEDSPQDIIIDSINNIYVTGTIYGNNKLYLIEFNKDGEFIWDSSSNDTLSFDGTGYKLGLDDKNNLYVIGATFENGIIGYDMVIFKLDPDKNLKWFLEENFSSGSNYPVETILNCEDDFTMFLKTGNTGIYYTTARYSNYTSDIKDPNNIKQFLLHQNYPNPFNPKTKIRYTIPSGSYVSLKIYDILGREITSAVNKYEASGNHEIIFDGSNLGSGIYFYKITAGSFSQIKKMILLK